MKIARLCCLARLALVTLVALSGRLEFSANAQSASADLWQARNGTPTSPRSPVEWVRGNASPANSHYIEGNSIPYRMIMSGLTPGPHRLVIEWDTLQGGAHAIDYITHYNRLAPHTQFGDHTAPELIQPLDGLPGPFSPPLSFPIPAPNPPGSPVPGLPASSFLALPEPERDMTIWNGRISALAYLDQQSLATNSSSTRLAIDFTADRDTVVIAWGGHIAAKLDWGAGRSATSIGGSPYHMRKIELDGAGGNQDRSVQALAVASPPTATIAGPASVCPARTNTFAVTTDAATTPSFAWTITDHAADAIIIGPTNQPTVQVLARVAGTFALEATVSVGLTKGVDAFAVTVTPPTSLAVIPDQASCPGSTVTFAAIASGTPPLSFDWTHNGQPVPDATNAILTLSQVGAADAGTYCVEARGACGLATACATLTLVPGPTLAGPPDLNTQCLSDVPPPDPGLVIASGPAMPITVRHAGDTAATNGCDIIVHRSYVANDACGTQATWVQTFLVRDTLPPVLAEPLNRQEEWGTDWTFDSPAIFEDCDPAGVRIEIADTVTNSLCGATYTATRTWLATDRCGNSTTTQQTITVVDTTAPVFAPLPPPTTIDCPAIPTFAQATATDAADPAVQLTFEDAIIEDLTSPGRNPAHYTVARFWTATDACGNSATASQTIHVKDRTAPTLACPNDLTVVCTGPEGAPVEFLVTATDACDESVAIVTTPASGAVFPLGRTIVRSEAVDASGNRSECSFVVTVIDVEAPSITCPTSFAVLESEAGSGQAAVEFPAPNVSDNADLSPAVACSPPSGSIFSLGETTVHCVATDASGNTNDCTFQVQVVPRTIVASSTADSGPGSLRQALLDANAAPGSNAVAFAFPGTPPFVIHLLTPLPTLTDPVLIDGWSQLEFRGFPIVELNGSNVVDAGEGPVGLDLRAGQSEVRGLTLHGFAIGLRVAGDGGHVVQGNFIGTDRTAATSPGNAGDGILILSPDNLIGGSTPAAANVIAGNRGNGLVFDGPAAVGSQVQGNWIGPAADATAPLGNGLNGVVFRNGASRNRIGPGNVIAFNALNGVLLEPSAGQGNSIRANRIFDNGALGIDLGGDGPTPNDPADADDGPNRLQNHPILTLALAIDGVSWVEGTLDSRPNQAFVIEFFLNPSIDPSGFGEGRQFLGETTVTTDDNGHGTFVHTFPFILPVNQFLTATATAGAAAMLANADTDAKAVEDTSEFSPAAEIGGPPIILVQPEGAIVAPGQAVTFCVTAGGSRPLTYQWRLNGANVPGATNECLTVGNAQLPDGGTYTVIVANDLGVAPSEPALLRLILPSLQAGDNFADRVPLATPAGQLVGNNIEATFEPGEPNHADKPGGKSIWYTWTAPATGIATFSTVGSTFDTLLAVYNGEAVDTLTNVASDEDRGGFFTSLLRFNAFAGTVYHIAVDGYGGASGEFVLNWSFEATSRLLPVVFGAPASQTVAPGSSFTFSVDASVDCRDPHFNCRRFNKDQPPAHPGERDPFLYQWFFNGVPIPGATASSLILSNIQDDAVGSYSVRVTGDGQSIETIPAILQINDTISGVQAVQARDKFLDAATAPPLRLGNPSVSFAASADPEEPGFAPAVVVRSYTSTQVFSSLGGTTSAGELFPCYGVGGASEWYAVVAEESGVLHVNTDGSSYDTVLAVYTYATPPTNGLALLGCDNNSGLDRRDSAVRVPVQAGRTNFIVIDGYNGAYGVARLNCTLVTPGRLTALGMTAQKMFNLRLTGRPAMRFSIEGSTNFSSWTSLITTNAATGTFDYIDRGSTNNARRFYRAIMLP